MHAYRVKKYIGAFCAVLGHVDAIAFTAGVGERGPEYRDSVLTGLEELGIVIDHEKNANTQKGEFAVIHAENSNMIRSGETRNVTRIPKNITGMTFL